MRKKIFQDKWITQLHIEISGTQVLYEFDIADFKLTVDPTQVIDEHKLRGLSGVDRSADYSMKNEHHFSQEDIIISFFQMYYSLGLFLIVVEGNGRTECFTNNLLTNCKILKIGIKNLFAP